MAMTSGDVIQSTITGEAFGQQIVHTRTWYVDTVSVPNISELDFMPAFLADTSLAGVHDLCTKYLDCVSSVYTALNYRVQKVGPIRWAKFQIDFPAATNGTMGPTNIGNSDAVLKVAGGLSGRKYIATYKIGPLSILGAANGLITNATKALLANYASTFVNTLGVSVGANLVVLVPAIYHAGHPKPPVVAPSADQIIQTEVMLTARAKTTRTVGRGK